jgi:hypothetical protein
MKMRIAGAALLASTLVVVQPVRSDEGRASALVEYDKLPHELKTKMTQHFWGHLPQKQRRTLVETYLRLTAAKVWDQVARVVREKNPAEAPASVGGVDFEVDGNSGGIVYEAIDGGALAEALKDTGRFKEDGAVMGSMHPGQRSIREQRSSSGDSLHVSVGPGNLFDAHVDKCSPEDAAGKWCHGTRELAPEAIRDVTGVPGVVIDGQVVPGSPERDPEIRGGIGIELRGPVDRKTRLPRSEPPEGEPLPADVMKRVLTRAAGARDVNFPVPKGLAPDEVPTPTYVAEEIAARIMAKARTGETRIQLDMVQYAHLKSLQSVVLGSVRRIGAEVHSEMMAAHAEDPSTIPDVSGVSSVTVTFGVPTQGGTVSLTRN